MANIDELNAKLLDLNVKRNAAQHDDEVCYQALCSHLMAVLEKNIGTHATKIRCTDTGATVHVANHTIDLYFETPWGDEGGKGLTLKLNFGCFGSFGINDIDEVKYCEVLGYIAGILGVIEHQLFKTELAAKLWSDYRNARHEFWHVKHEVEAIENEIKSIERVLKTNEILSKLAVGMKIMVAKATFYRPPIVKTIGHITSKNIIFEEDHGSRTKKDHLISFLLSGKWLLA